MAAEVTLTAIRDADPSWPERIRSELHDIQFDSEADILYIAFGAQQEALSIPLDVPGEDLYLRVNAESLQVVGLDILHFRRTFLPKHADAKQAFDPLFNLLGVMDWRLQVRLPSEDVAGQVALLLPASVFLKVESQEVV